MNEKELAEQLKKFQELAKKDKDIDVTSLSIQALQSFKKNLIPAKEKRWAYLIAIGLPPFGLFFAIKFYLSDKEDKIDAAFMCVLLTFVGIVLFALLLKLPFSGVSSLGNIPQAQPANIQDLYQ